MSLARVGARKVGRERERERESDKRNLEEGNEWEENNMYRM
jgi:hypothetical protein